MQVKTPVAIKISDFEYSLVLLCLRHLSLDTTRFRYALSRIRHHLIDDHNIVRLGHKSIFIIFLRLVG